MIANLLQMLFYLSSDPQISSIGSTNFEVVAIFDEVCDASRNDRGAIENYFDKNEYSQLNKSEIADLKWGIIPTNIQGWLSPKNSDHKYAVLISSRRTGYGPSFEERKKFRDGEHVFSEFDTQFIAPSDHETESLNCSLYTEYEDAYEVEKSLIEKYLLSQHDKKSSYGPGKGPQKNRNINSTSWYLNEEAPRFLLTYEAGEDRESGLLSVSISRPLKQKTSNHLYDVPPIN